MNSSRENTFILKQEDELRVEIDEKKEITVNVIQGDAEVFGVELPNKIEVKFTNTKFAIFTFFGCKVVIKGETIRLPYVASGCHLLYTNIHYHLELIRQESRKNEGVNGPRAIIVAPMNSGKSTLCRILTSYAARCGTTPIFVELDVDQGDVSIPGCISASVVDSLSISPQVGYDVHTPISYFFGSYRAMTNLSLYKALISELSFRVENACKKQPEVRSGGIIINTPGWVDETGLNIIEEVIYLFHVGIVLVIDSDVIYNTFKQKFGDNLSIENISKSGGVVTKFGEYKDKSRKRRIYEYFYGNSYLEYRLNPSVVVFQIDYFQYVSINEKIISENLLPKGEQAVSSNIHYDIIEPDISFIGKILGLSYANNLEEVILSPVAGFCRVQDIDPSTNVITLLAPNSSNLHIIIIFVNLIYIYYIYILLIYGNKNEFLYSI